MLLSDISIKRPILMTMIIFTFLVIGLFSLTKLGIDLFPKIDFPYVTIVTVYPGAGPEEVETLITKPVEEAVSSISGLRNMTSIAQEGMSLTFLEFELSKSVDLAAIDVKEKVDAIRGDLPEDAVDPQIQKFDIGSMPIINLAVSSSRPLDQLYIFCDEDIKTRLNRIDGLANVEIVGGKEREIVVAVDRRKLEARGLSILQVVQALGQENMNLPSGHITAGRKEYSIRVKGEFENVQQIQDLYLPMTPGQPAVRLADVATVNDTYAEQRELARMNGVSSIGLSLVKRSDANAVQVGRKVKLELAELAKILPKDVKIDVARDRTTFIQDSVNDVWSNLLSGILLTALVLFMFLHSWKGTVIAAISMPIAVVSTFTLLLFAGFTLNMMSLMALAISVGILVSNSIVVLENIERYQLMGHPPAEAARLGTNEIAIAVSASTLTNVVVFTPIAFMSGIIGQFFKEFGLTVTFATLISLFISLTMVPMMASVRISWLVYAVAGLATGGLVLFALGPVTLAVIVAFLLLILILTRTGQLKKIFTAWDKMYDDLAASYRRGLAYFLNRQVLLFGIVTLLFVSSLVVAALFVGSEFMPQADMGNFSVSVEMPAGATMAETDRVLRRIEDEINKLPELGTVYSQVGTNESGGFSTSQGIHLGVVVVQLKDKPIRKRSVYEIIEYLRPRLTDMPAAQILLQPGNLFGGGQADLEIEIEGPEMDQLAQLSDRLVDMTGKVRGVIDPRSSWKTGKPELKISPQRLRIADQNLSIGELALSMRTMIEGQKVSKYREGSREYNIRVKLSDADLQQIRDVPDFAVMTMQGPQKISSIADLDYMEGPSQIMRKNKERMVTVSAEVSGTTIGEAQKLIQANLDTMKIPEGYTVRFGGQSEHMAESFAEMGRAMILAIILTYMLMAAIMESYLHPLIIMATLPLGLIGVLFALFLTGKAISIYSLMAVIMLVGIVVNNGILLIDFIQTTRREEKLPLLEAILKASPTRLRPIIMTNLAASLGMLPLALGIGAGGEARSPMAISAIGGFITSTIFTLYLIPAIYYTLEKMKLKGAKQ
ncbi:MAG: efflux RND transporter permease subunit [bacterium]|nr:efflux RND transporter permease subunit [bacterium]